MSKAANTSAEQVSNKNPTTASTNQSVSQVKNLMEEEGQRAIPVTDDKNRVKGAISYRDLIRHMQFNPHSTKLEKVIHQPPEFDKSDSLIELAELRINSGRKMMVNTSGNKLESVLGDDEFLESMKPAEELESVSTGRLAQREVIDAFEDDSIEKVRHKMLDQNISRIPIVNDSGKLVGILRSMDLLKAIVERESMAAGGTAGNRDGSEMKISGGGEKDSFSDIPVSEIMKRTVNQSEEHLSSNEALKQISENDSGEIVFVDDGYPEAIVTLKDFIQQLARFKQEDGILLTLVGLDMAEEKAAVSKKIRNQIRGSLGRKLENPDELKFRFKKADKDGKKHRYEVNVQLVDGKDVFNLEVEEWDILDAVDEALDELNAILRKRKGKKKN